MSSIKLKHSSGNSMSLAAPATNPSGDLTLTLPVNIGADKKILAVNGSGNLEFIYPPGYGYFQAFITSSNQSISHHTQTTTAMNGQTFDSQDWYNTSTYKYTPQVAGTYRIFTHLTYTGIGSHDYQAANYIYKNTSVVSEAIYGVNQNAYGYQVITSDVLVSLNGSSDYILLKAYYYDSGSNGASLRGYADESYMGGYLVEAD
tara:strand:+ start:2619 stop:3227 length:609 start_codon:yes stop_codon:yes gene_type:complete